MIRKEKSHSKSHHGKAGESRTLIANVSLLSLLSVLTKQEGMENTLQSSLPRALLEEASTTDVQRKDQVKITAFTSPIAPANTGQSDILFFSK